MTAENAVTLVGNVTRDPELRFTPSGAGVASFGLAVNRRYRKGEEWVEDTSFFDVKAWGQLADNVSASFTKGDRLIVVGRLEQRSWEADDGQKRSKIEVVADEVGASVRWGEVTGFKKNERGGGQSSGGQRQPQRSAPADGPGDEPF